MIQISFKTKTQETHSFESAGFSLRIWAEEENPRWNISVSFQIEKGLDPFLLQLTSRMLNQKEPSGIEVTISYSKIENDIINKSEIVLRNARIQNSLSENASCYNNSWQFNGNFEINSDEATIYGVDFPYKS